MPRRARSFGPRPEGATGPARTLARAFSGLFEAWAASVLAGLSEGPTGDRADASDWVSARMVKIRASLEAALREAGWQGAIGLVTERVTRKAGKGLPRVQVRPYVGAGTIEKFRSENVSKIRSIAEERLSEVEGLLVTAEHQGWSVGEISKQLRESFDVSKSKAELLARDQTLKLHGAITRARQEQAGIEEYKWSTSSDERVRSAHKRLHGRVFRWDDPPIISDDGRRGHPGEDYQCRCIAIPVLPDLG